MKQMIKNLKPYWKMVVIILLFLFAQAYCDLALPQFTSNIIDVGIQDGGITSVLPEKMTEEEYGYAKIFMSQEEQDMFDSLYEKNGENMVRKQMSEKDLASYDDTFSMIFVMDYQMKQMEESAVKEMMLAQMKKGGMDVSRFESSSVEEIGKMMGISLQVVSTEETDDNGNKKTVSRVDVRPLLQMMMGKSPAMRDTLLNQREEMSKSMSAMGTSMVKKQAIVLTSQLEKEAGVDTDKKQTDYLWMSGGKMLLLSLIMAIATVIVGFFAAKVGAGVGRDLRERLFEKVVNFSSAEMDRFSTASLITRSTNDVQQIQMVTIMLLRMVAYAPILGIGGVIKVVNTGAGMGWIIVLAIIVILGFVLFLMAVAMPKFKLMQKLIDRLNLVSREILTGLNVIRAFGREKKEEERFDEANVALTKTMLFTNRVMTFMMPIMMLIMYGLTILIEWVAAHRIDDGVLQVGAMTAFITYAIMIVMSFLILTMMSIMLPRAAVAAKRIEEVFETEISIKDPENAEDFTDNKDGVKFDHVYFRYPGAKEDVLEDIDFTAERGKTTAIIGSTGCGKSTLVNLIPRLYDVTAGNIYLDRKETRTVSLENLRSKIGFVPQKAILFSGTIASNLRFGNQDASETEIWDAAEIAQASEFIQEKNEKLESTIAQGGSNVSGGQKQRLSIARAIAKKPELYVFDDSFSALDLKTDAALRKELSAKTKDAAVIIVAQRVSTIVHADQIIVLEDGKIAGKGTHKELMHNCEVYAQIASSQMTEKEIEKSLADNEEANGKEAF